MPSTDFNYYVVESDGHIASRHRTIKRAEFNLKKLHRNTSGSYNVIPAPAVVTLDQKYRKAIDALMFIAFNNAPCWKDSDRRNRAATTLVELGEVKKL